MRNQGTKKKDGLKEKGREREKENGREEIVLSLYREGRVRSR